MDHTRHIPGEAHERPEVRSDLITCPHPGCEDGTVWVEKAGGAWNSYLGGYEPDEEPAPCDVCQGHGTVEVNLCERCGRPTEDTAPSDLPAADLCTCDDDDVAALLHSMGAPS